MKKPWTVITPAGNLYVESVEEAKHYRDVFGYPYVRTKFCQKPMGEICLVDKPRQERCGTCGHWQ